MIYGMPPPPANIRKLEQVFGLPIATPDPTRGHKGIVVLDRKWVNKNLIVEWFPIIGMRCVHQYMAAALYQALAEIDQHPDETLREYFKLRQCGTFVARTVGWKEGNPLSTHALGIAIDINWNDNPWGKSTGTILGVPEIIEAFKRAGFTWGGDFKNKKDLMHFQYCHLSIILPRTES